MRNLHQKNTVRYYVILIALLSLLFFSSDFGLIDVQKTAIVMAVGIDREDDTFIVTSQIAIPQASKQGSASETVQIVSRSKTVADAFEEINAKTGWYPKLVFCRVLLLGEKAIEQNVFDALDFFLLDEYMSDNCLVAACEGTAKDMLNVSALVDSAGALAIQKVLSPHSERVGTVLPSTLREFAIGYFSDAQSGYLPVLKTQPQQEQISGENSGGNNGQSSQGGNGQTGGQSSSSSGSSGGSSGGQSSEQTKNKPVFSASETALFLRGKRVGTLTDEETFALNAVQTQLKLASYTVDVDGGACTLNIKHNRVGKKVLLGKDGRATLKLNVKLTAGMLDYSKSLPLQSIKDSGTPPSGSFAAAEKRLMGQIHTTFEKCRACQCDVFGLQDWLQKYKFKQYDTLKDGILQNAVLDVQVQFRSVR